MMCVDLNFFKQLINDENVMDGYKELLMFEYTNEYHCEVKSFAKYLNMCLKAYKIINCCNDIKLKLDSNTYYKISSKIYGCDVQLENAMELYHLDNISEKECLTIFKNFLKAYKKKRSKPTENSGVANLYLYESAMSKLRKNRDIYYNNCIKTNKNNNKGISLYFPSDFNIGEHMKNMEAVKQHIKSLC